MIPTDTKNPRILLLDDEEIVLVALKQTLIRENYEVLSTTNPEEALGWCRTKEFAVILSDQRMPEMTGLDFFNQLKEIQPHASRILLTAVVSLSTVIEAINRGEIYRFLTKPWVREELLVTLRNAVQRFELVRSNQSLKADSSRLSEELSEANDSLKSKVKELERQKAELETVQASLKRNFESSLKLCYRILETFHPLLARQTQACVELAKRFASTDKLTAGEKQILIASAWLQNIGLIGVSRDILRKARDGSVSLTEEERAMIENHPVLGANLVPFGENLEGVSATIRAHHERFDGEGYPEGLSSEQIPWTAHCLAVIAYYVESTLPSNTAMEFILENSGKAFHPEAVRIFAQSSQLVDVPRALRELPLNELKPGMRLAHNLYTTTGSLLMSEGEVIDQRTITDLRKSPNNRRALVHSD